MPNNNFSVGRDITLSIVTNRGPLNFTLITGFQSKPNSKTNSIKGLDGITRSVRFPDGWSGSFSVERQNSAVDDYFAGIEKDFHAGLNEAPVTITETITEPNGGVSQYRFLGVMLSLDDAGSWEGDKTVSQKISFLAQRRIKIS